MHGMVWVGFVSVSVDQNAHAPEEEGGERGGDLGPDAVWYRRSVREDGTHVRPYDFTKRSESS